MQGTGKPPSLQALGLAPGARRRAWAGLLALVLVLASFMHVAHSHDADAPSISKQHCSYCGAFDRGAAPPPAPFALLPTGPAPSLVAATPRGPGARVALRGVGQPRAPPVLQA
jgi:hypothetical protein